jgi:thioredoxin 1
MRTASDEEFETLVADATDHVLVFLSANWCGPCRMIVPSLNDLAEGLSDRLKVVRMDIDKDPKSPQSMP